MYGLESFYVILFTTFIFIYFLSKSAMPQNEKNLYYSFCIVLLFLSCFRSTKVGGDLYYYIPHFQEVCNGAVGFDMFNLLAANFEPGYTILVKGLSFISTNVRGFLILTALISLIGPFIFIKKISPLPCMSLLVYCLLGFYTNTFNNIRQSIAISICLCLIPMLYQGSKLRFIVGTLIASSIHYSAIFFILALPLSKIKLNTKNFLLMLIVAVVFFFTVGNLAFSKISTVLLSKYEEIEGQGAGYSMLILYIVLTLLCYFVYKITKKNYTDEMQVFYVELFIKFLIMSIAIQLFAPMFSSMVRLSFYYFIPVVVLIPTIISKIKETVVRGVAFVSLMVALVFYSSFIIYRYNDVTMSNGQGVIPYELSFNEN